MSVLSSFVLKKPGQAAFANALLRNLAAPQHTQIRAESSIAEVSKAYALPYNLIKAFYKKRRPDQRLKLYTDLNGRPELGVHFFDRLRERPLFAES